MATLTIRDLDDDLKAALRIRAAAHGRSMESEVREILRQTLTNQETGGGLGSRIAARFADLDGPPLELPPRTELPRAAEFPE
ncbi:MAG TPA: Arc family DNA-binding protein [Pseudonocardiaceae bacterium]|jgi:plasmid stability protein|nr:Arc family DNA-binding protein [Pseudonocardiaceae bacterium]